MRRRSAGRSWAVEEVSDAAEHEEPGYRDCYRPICAPAQDVMARFLVAGATDRGTVEVDVFVFGGEEVSAPRSFKSRLKDIEAACEDIRGRWRP